MNSSLAFCKYSDASVIEPVTLRTIPPARIVRERICDRFYSNGFVIVRFAGLTVNTQNMARLSEALSLGMPYDQRQDGSFEKNQYRLPGFNLVGGKLPDSPGPSVHPAFSTIDKQDIHSDGTRHPVGLIKTTALLCVQPGKSGGESTLFNSVAAFAALCRESPPLAAALLDERAMVREMEPGKQLAGPAFKITGNGLLSRFSIGGPISWGTDSVPGLGEAVQRMRHMAVPGTKYFVKFPLARGDMLIVANDWIAHGREAYENSAVPRKMWRALFTTRPGVGLGTSR